MCRYWVPAFAGTTNTCASAFDPLRTLALQRSISDVQNSGVTNLAFAGLGILALSGCQLDYRVSVNAENGQLTFNTVWKRFGRDKPASVRRLEVDEHSTQSRTVWEIESVATNGRELRRLGYGQLPGGFRQKVAPKPLKVGQMYMVTLWGPEGMDQTYFVIARYDLSRGITVLHQ